MSEQILFIHMGCEVKKFRPRERFFLDFCFDELIDSSNNGCLIVNGSATLGPGSLLDISLLNGFTPAMGETFTIMDFLVGSGTFANAPATGFVMDGFNWDIAYDSDNIALTAQAPSTPELPTA